MSQGLMSWTVGRCRDYSSIGPAWYIVLGTRALEGHPPSQLLGDIQFCTDPKLERENRGEERKRKCKMGVAGEKRWRVKLHKHLEQFSVHGQSREGEEKIRVWLPWRKGKEVPDTVDDIFTQGRNRLLLEKFRSLGKDWLEDPEGGSSPKRGEGDQPGGARRIWAHSFLFTFCKKPRNGREIEWRGRKVSRRIRE